MEINANHEQIQTTAIGTYMTVHSQSFTSIHSSCTHLRAIAENTNLDTEKFFPSTNKPLALQNSFWHLKKRLSQHPTFPKTHGENPHLIPPYSSTSSG